MFSRFSTCFVPFGKFVQFDVGMHGPQVCDRSTPIGRPTKNGIEVKSLKAAYPTVLKYVYCMQAVSRRLLQRRQRCSGERAHRSIRSATPCCPLRAQFWTLPRYRKETPINFVLLSFSAVCEGRVGWRIVLRPLCRTTYCTYIYNIYMYIYIYIYYTRDFLHCCNSAAGLLRLECYKLSGGAVFVLGDEPTAQTVVAVEGDCHRRMSLTSYVHTAWKGEMNIVVPTSSRSPSRRDTGVPAFTGAHGK